MATILTGSEFSGDIQQASQSALRGPVFVIEDGEPVHVLLSIEHYRRLTGKGRSLLESLSMADIGPVLIDIIYARNSPAPAAFD